MHLHKNTIGPSARFPNVHEKIKKNGMVTISEIKNMIAVYIVYIILKKIPIPLITRPRYYNLSKFIFRSQGKLPITAPDFILNYKNSIPGSGQNQLNTVC